MRVTDSFGVFKDIRDFPALSIFLWEDGSRFDQTMNDYMSAPFPAGIDPANPTILQSNLLSLGNSTTAGLLLTGNVSIS